MATTSVRYHVISPIKAVQLVEHPGSRLRDPTATLLEIPAGSVIEMEGSSGPSGLVIVLWEGNAFSVLHEDLRDRARAVHAA